MSGVNLCIAADNVLPTSNLEEVHANLSRAGSGYAVYSQ
ncbi:hypothetical protein MP213Fo_10570 [Pseudochrobactrum sp. MP213Fo]